VILTQRDHGDDGRRDGDGDLISLGIKDAS
jgi:hypothetical protein